MTISYNWLKDFVQFDKSPEELSLILTDIGLEVESLETVQSIPGGLEGLVIGQVKTCQQHPNADRLRVTTVDVGRAEHLHIVCGAPNVANGQKVVVATVGTTVHPLAGEPFKINKSKIRGEVSEGMICAEDEIGLGQSHAGIMVLPDDAPVGQDAKSYFGVEDDYVYEIGLTPNRADAASHLGVARDVAAYFRGNYILPDVSAFASQGNEITIPVTVEAPDSCPRYGSTVVRGVRVAESPDWLRKRLQAIGVRPINNVVDITNYVLHELGQPLHAFDAERIAGGRVVVRRAKAGEAFVTLDGVERKLHEEDLLICDAEKPMCIAGVFGGEHAGVTHATTDVFLESAYFNPVSVRKTSKRHALKTDASFRFERGVDPNITELALKRAALLITEIAGGQIVSPAADFYPSPVPPFVFSVRYQNVQRLIGADIPAVEIRAIIEALGIQVLDDDGVVMQVSVPPFKVDVTREADITEEVLRIYGYNNIPIPSQVKASTSTSAKPDREVVQNQIADLLVGNGYREILSNSLTKLAYADDQNTAVRILNPLSSDLDSMRQNLLYSVLEAIEYNQKRKHADLKLFEFGQVYQTADDGFRERQQLAIGMTGKSRPAHWQQVGQKVTFFELKGAVDAVLKRLKISGWQLADVDDNPHFDYGLRYVMGDGRLLATFGAVSSAALRKADADGEVFFAVLEWDTLLKAIRKNTIRYQEVAKFPAVRRDLALLVDESVNFETLRSIAEKSERKLLKSINVFDVYKGDRIPSGKKSYALGFVLQDDEKTLNDKQIDAVIQRLIHNFGKEIGAEVRK